MLQTKLCAALTITLVISCNSPTFARRVIGTGQTQKKTIYIPKDECSEPALKKPLKLTMKIKSYNGRESTCGKGINGEFTALTMNELRFPNGNIVPAGAVVTGDFAPHADDGSQYYFFREIDSKGRAPLPIEASFEVKGDSVPIQRGGSVIFVKDAGPYYFVKHTPQFNEKYERMHQGLKNFLLKVDDMFAVLIGSGE